MATESKVLLYSKILDEERSFDITHAQRVLDSRKTMPASDWELKDPKYTVKDGIIQLADTGTNQKPAKKGSATESNPTGAEA